MKKYDIYLIWGKDCDGNILRYYGSTADLIKRKSEHIKNYNKWVKAGRPSNNTKCSSVYILDNGDWKIEKIDEIIGERWEAKKKEGEYQKNNDCINVQIASRTPKEYRDDNKGKIAEYLKQYQIDNKYKLAEYNKKYRVNNKDKIAEQKKEYRADNKEKLTEWHKQYYIDNKQAITEKNKEYYEKNRDKMSEKKKEKIICECGSKLRKSDLSQHLKTKKHINFINSANND